MKRLESEKETMQLKIASLKEARARYAAQNLQFDKDIRILEKRAAKKTQHHHGKDKKDLHKLSASERKLTVPWWIGIGAVVSAVFSALAIATDGNLSL